MRILILALLFLFPLTAQAKPLSRDVYLQAKVDDVSAFAVINMLRALDSVDHTPITLHITSPGGFVVSGLLIIDTMSSIASPVNTVCEGMCASMAAIILTSGHHREAQPNATIMVHGISSVAQGKLPELITQVNEAVRLQKALDGILVARTGMTLEQVRAMESFDHWMSPEEAMKLGLIDAIQKPGH